MILVRLGSIPGDLVNGGIEEVTAGLSVPWNELGSVADLFGRDIRVDLAATVRAERPDSHRVDGPPMLTPSRFSLEGGHLGGASPIAVEPAAGVLEVLLRWLHGSSLP
nr:hypothetical protein [Tetrasphaera sp. HKS02]